MMDDDLKSLTDKTHNEITTFDFGGKPTPCIIFEARKFDSICKKVAGQALSIYTDLNILKDDLGHVFVEIILTFSKGGFVEKILINANDNLEFFELLAATSILTLSSPKSEFGQGNVFTIQLPRPDKAADALEIIKKGLAVKN